MSQSGFTPIQLYRSATAATLPVAGNLAAGELAINTTDEKLYFENTGGTVTLLASSAAAGGTFTTVTATTVVNGLGAVGTPSYTFTGDLNTGMWSPAADTIAFSEGGAEAMRIDSSGNLGIGTSAPGTKLQVLGTVAAQFAADGTNAHGVRLIPSSTGEQTVRFTATDGTGRAAITGTDVGGGPGAMRFYTNNPLAASTERMIIDSAGNVGIGTTTPSYALDVSATGNISGQFKTSGSINALYLADAGTTAGTLYVGTVGNDFRVVTASNERMRITSAGNVGIGTTTPGALLDVNGVGRFGGTPSIISVGLNGDSISSNGDFYVQTSTANPIILRTNFAEVMRLTSAGNVGIGTTAPVGRLNVAAADTSNTLGSATASLNITNTDAAAFGRTSNLNFTVDDGNLTSRRLATIAAVYTGFSGGSTAGALAFATQYNGSLSERMRITEAGDVGIGTSTPTLGGLDNLAILNAGLFTTARGTVSAGNGVATTISISNQNHINATYIVSCGLSSGAPTVYSAVAIVSADNNVLRSTTLQVATLMTISVSGTSIQATQSSGVTQTIFFNITRVS